MPDLATGLITSEALEVGEPVFTNTTERLYRRLPKFYRREDLDQGWVFKKWIAGIVDQAGGLEDLLNKIGNSPVDGSMSDLADPLVADPLWFPWIAQLTGVLITDFMSEQQQRDRLARSTYFKGTKEHIIEVAKTQLTGDQFVDVRDHSTSVATIGAGTEWDLLIITKASETPLNRLPYQAANLGAANAWNGTPNVSRKEVVDIFGSYGLFKKRALRIQDSASGGLIAFRAKDGFKIATTINQLRTFVLSYTLVNPEIITGPATVPRTPTINIEWLNSIGTVIGTATGGDITTGDHLTKTLTATAPTNTTHARPMFSVSLTAADHVAWVAQAGFYEGQAGGWTDADTSPAVAVVAAGAAPAGVIVYWASIASAFNAIEVGAPTWDVMDTKTWDQLEIME